MNDTSTLIQPKRTSDICAEFDQKADIYESYRLAPWYKAHAEIVQEHLDLSTSDRIIDIGCGTGYLLRRLVEATPGLKAIGVDLSSRMVARAQAHARSELNADMASRLQFKQADWINPNADLCKTLSAFSATQVTMLSALHYFPSLSTALSNAKTIMQPGGRIWLWERERHRSILNSCWDFAHQHVIGDHVAFFTGDEIIESLNKAGFCNAEIPKRIHKWMWHGKLFTNMLLVTAVNPTKTDATAHDIIEEKRRHD